MTEFDFTQLDQIVLTVTPLTLIWIEAMKKSAFSDKIKGFLPLLSFPIAVVLVYFLHWLDLMQSTIIWFFVGLSANGLYDQWKDLINKFWNLAPKETQEKIKTLISTKNGKN